MRCAQRAVLGFAHIEEQLEIREHLAGEIVLQPQHHARELRRSRHGEIGTRGLRLGDLRRLRGGRLGFGRERQGRRGLRRLGDFRGRLRMAGRSAGVATGGDVRATTTGGALLCGAGARATFTAGLARANCRGGST